MSLLEKITNEKADAAEVKQMFEMMEHAVGAVPEPLRMLAISPGLFARQTSMIGYYRDHPRLSPELLTMIRFAAASWFKNRACVDFNGGLLKRQGMADSELEAVLEQPESAPLQENEQKLLAFILKGLKEQKEADQADIETLRQLGWQDSDILDSVNHAFSLYASGRMLELFGMLD